MANYLPMQSEEIILDAECINYNIDFNVPVKNFIVQVFDNEGKLKNFNVQRKSANQFVISAVGKGLLNAGDAIRYIAVM